MAGKWIMLERLKVDSERRVVVSVTDHFTDMMNGTVTEQRIFVHAFACDERGGIILGTVAKQTPMQMVPPVRLITTKSRSTPIGFLTSAGQGTPDDATMLPMPTETVATDLFLRMADAFTQGIRMVPRSANDKEYFPQDWFKDRVESIPLRYDQQGRNSYPDFWVYKESLQEGYEIKSLSFRNGRPARKDIDFNSTIPSGRKEGCDVFLVFFLYTGSGSDERPVHSLSLAHCDLINSDHSVADAHINIAIHEFGAYGDGFIRNRKMYVFPHPITVDQSGLGRARLIIPSRFEVSDDRLRKVSTLCQDAEHRLLA